MFLKQSTAFTDRIGPFLDKTDGVTEEVGLTTASSAIFLSKNGGNFVVKNDATALAHDQDGWYVIVYDATDTATVGKLEVMVQAPATHLPVWKTYWVLEEAIYNALFAASAAGFDANQRVDIGSILGGAVPTPAVTGVPDVNVTHVGDTAQTAGDLAALVVTADAAVDVAVADLANATDGLSALKTLIDAIPTTAMRGTDSALTDKDGFTLSTAGVLAIWHQLNSAISTAGSMGKLLKDEITSARMAILTDWINGGRLDLLLDAIPTTAMRGTDSAALASEVTAARMATITDWINGGRLDLLLDAIPTTAMRGTDNAALASEVTAVRMATLTDWINGGRLDLLLDAIKLVIDKMVFTKANELDVNVQSINGATVVGDGNATPWDGA